MNYPIYSQQNMIRRSYILFNLILSSCSIDHGVRKFIKKGDKPVNKQWTNPCPSTWSTDNDHLSTCFPKNSEEMNCTALSESYNINKVKELYVNIQTETRECVKAYGSNCTGKFNLLVHYEINNKIYKSFILPNEIPNKILSIKNTEWGRFFATDDTVSFYVEQNYQKLKLGFQAPYYCGSVKSMSVYYYLCPTETNSLVNFLEVNAPSKMSSPYTSLGTCTRNAVKKSNSRQLSMKCYYNGTGEVFGGCECEAGYAKKKTICEGKCFCLLPCKSSGP